MCFNLEYVWYSSLQLFGAFVEGVRRLIKARSINIKEVLQDYKNEDFFTQRGHLHLIIKSRDQGEAKGK